MHNCYRREGKRDPETLEEIIGMGSLYTLSHFGVPLLRAPVLPS